MGRKKLVIIGATEFAEIAFEYFMIESEYEVVAFTVDREYRRMDYLKGKPVIAFDELREKYPSDNYYLFTAITYGKMNDIRKRFYETGKKWGYRFATYISPYSFVWNNVRIGEDTFIFENNTIQYNAYIGTGVVLWSGNHIGHSAVIKDFSFISSHVVISGFCIIGMNSFCGVNSTLGNNIELGDYSLVGAGTVVTHSQKIEGNVYVGNPCRIIAKSAHDCL